MVIKHNDIHATSLEFGDLTYRRGASINGDEQLRSMLFEATLDTFAAQTVAFLHSQRQEQFSRSRGTISSQHLVQQRQRGHAIYIVIAKEHDAFVSIQRSENTSNCRVHLRQQKRIAQ